MGHEYLHHSIRKGMRFSSLSHLHCESTELDQSRDSRVFFPPEKHKTIDLENG